MGGDNHTCLHLSQSGGTKDTLFCGFDVVTAGADLADEAGSNAAVADASRAANDERSEFAIRQEELQHTNDQLEHANAALATYTHYGEICIIFSTGNCSSVDNSNITL